MALPALPKLGNWSESISGLLQSLPTLRAAPADQQPVASASVLLKLPPTNTLVPEELRQSDSAELSALRDEARSIPAESSKEEQIRGWLRYARALTERLETGGSPAWAAKWRLQEALFTVELLKDELTLVLRLLAALWRQIGREYASDILLQEEDQQRILTKAAITALKQSAAVYQYIVQHHLAYDAAGSIDRTPALHKGVAQALGLLAHAEVQAMVSHLAMLNRLKKVLGCLHVAAADQFSAAATQLKEVAFGEHMVLLVQYAELTASFQNARARMSVAFMHEDNDPATSWADAKEAVQLFENSAEVAHSHEAWAAAYAAERLAAEGCVQHFKELTVEVALRGSPGTPSSLPEGKLQAVPDFNLSEALDKLPNLVSLSSPR